MKIGKRLKNILFLQTEPAWIFCFGKDLLLILPGHCVHASSIFLEGQMALHSGQDHLQPDRPVSVPASFPHQHMKLSDSKFYQVWCIKLYTIGTLIYTYVKV